MPNKHTRDQLKKDTVLPNTVDDLLELLERLYPAQSASPNETFEQLMYRGGQRSVIDFLQELKKRSEM